MAISLDLKLISCKELKSPIFNFFQKLNTYAIISIRSPFSQQHVQQQKSPVDKVNDQNPEWHFALSFTNIQLNDDMYLIFDLYCEVAGGVLGDKLIGQVKVQLEDLVKQQQTNKSVTSVKFVSYQVNGIDGKCNGVLNFSYKFNVDESVETGVITEGVGGSNNCYPVLQEVSCYTTTSDLIPTQSVPAAVPIGPVSEHYGNGPGLEACYPPREIEECCYPPMMDTMYYSPLGPPMDMQYYHRPPPPHGPSPPGPPVDMPYYHGPPPPPPPPHAFYPPRPAPPPMQYGYEYEPRY